MSKTPKILVTGGTGLIGSAIQRYIDEINPELGQSARWMFVGSSPYNLLHYNDVEKLFAYFRPTHVIHLAAKVGGLYKNQRAKLAMYQDNMKINDHIMRAAANCEVDTVVCCLSTCVFPDKVEYPFDESQLHNGPPHHSNEGYVKLV